MSAVPASLPPTVAPAPFVTISLASSLTGYTEKAIRRKIEEGHWLEGREYISRPGWPHPHQHKGVPAMGRQGSGVEVREKSIRLAFVYEGSPVRKTLCTDGKPMLPTPANIKFAHRLASEIKDKLRHGTFVMAEYFPASGAGGALTVGAQLDTWLAAQRIELSTKAGYKSAVTFWRETLGDKPLRALKRTDILTVTADRNHPPGRPECAASGGAVARR